MIYVGTSGWAYKAWQPAFFPEKLPQKRYLEHYASRLNAVEVNYSFRRLIPESTLRNWIETTPQHFRFCVKAHQAITHMRRLKNAGDSLKRFLDSIEPLAAAGKLGCVLFQLPPNLKGDPTVLDEFLAEVPRAVKAAFEFREASWFDERVYEVLRQHKAALCLAENEELETPEVFTAPFVYFRFRKPDYNEQERRTVAKRLVGAEPQAREVYAFFKHEERPESPLYAEEVLKMASAEKQAA